MMYWAVIITTFSLRDLQNIVSPLAGRKRAAPYIHTQFCSGNSCDLSLQSGRQGPIDKMLPESEHL